MCSILPLVPLDLLRILPDVGDIRVGHLLSGTRRDLEDDLVQTRRAQNVNVVARSPASAGDGRDRVVRQLVNASRPRNGRANVSPFSYCHGSPTKRRQTHLDGRDRDPGRVPPRPLPALDTHRAETEQAHRPVALAHLHAVHDGRVRGLVRVLCVDAVRRACQGRHVERRARGRAVRAAPGRLFGAERRGRVVVRRDLVGFGRLLGVPVGALYGRYQGQAVTE